MWANVDWTSFRNKWQEWSGQGLRLVDIDVSRAGSDTRYSGVFLAARAGTGRSPGRVSPEAEQEHHGGFFAGFDVTAGTAAGDGSAQFDVPGAPPGANGAAIPAGAAIAAVEDPRGDGVVYASGALH